jgi:hypothetical protein
MGMIVTDAGVYSEATPLYVIQRAISNWNYPWQLVARGSTPIVGSATIPAASGERPIVVWRVGSPYDTNVPDTTVPLDLQLGATQIGHKINIQSFPAKGFAS